MAEAPSQLRQNYGLHCEEAVNTHIHLLLHASYVYLSMAFYFDRGDVARGNFKRFFLSKSHNCKASAQMFMFLQNMRGGRIVLHNIPKPDQGSWQGGLRAMECAFHMEMNINRSLLNLHMLAKGNGDAHLCCYLEHYCLDGQVHVLREMNGHLTNLRHMGAPANCMAEYLFDKLSL